MEMENVIPVQEQGLDQVLNVLIAVLPEVGSVPIAEEQENKGSSSLPEWAGSYI